MWGRYHKLRSSESYRTTWSKFLKALGCEAAGPIFYQFVTDSLMQQLIKLHYPIMVQSTDDEVGIDYEERCTIRYSAESIIRSLTKKILRSKDTQKKKL